MNPLVTYRYPESGDAATLAAFAGATFVEAYRDQIPLADLEAHARDHFTTEQLRREIASPQSIFIIAEDAGRLAGYALSWIDSLPECELAASRPAQLQRIYVDAAWQGRGVARELMVRTLVAAADAGCDMIWLAVWEANPRALRFYQKSGFQIVGEQSFLLGAEVQRDFVMAWPHENRDMKSVGPMIL